jgi:DNA-binding transcriptional MerR regulator
VPKSGTKAELLSVADLAARAGVTRFRVHYVADSGALGPVAWRDGARRFTAVQAQMLVEIVRLTELGTPLPEAAALLQAHASGQLDIVAIQSAGRAVLEEAERAMGRVFVYARLLMAARAGGEDDKEKS